MRLLYTGILALLLTLGASLANVTLAATPPRQKVIVDADINSIDGAMQSDRKDLEQLLGHPTTSLRSAVEAALK